MVKFEPVIFFRMIVIPVSWSMGFHYKLGINLIGSNLGSQIKYSLKLALFQERIINIFKPITNGRKRRKIRKS